MSIKLDKFSSSFLNKLIKTVRDSNLLTWGERVVTAVSGGIDSSVLLYSLYELRHYLGIDIACASFDHNIRPSSGEDIIFVKDFCKKLSIPFYTEDRDVKSYAKENKLNLEEAARILRYRFLIKTADDFKAKKIAVAHHLDDFAENLIMRLITGGGTGAISGFKTQSGMVIRPLINHSKSEIIDFANKNSVKFVEDDTNKDTKILRNFVRLNIIPSFKELNPSFLKTVKNTSEILEKDDDFIKKTADKIFKDIARPDAGGKRFIFKKEDLSNLEDALLYRILKISVFNACGCNSKDKNNFFVKKPVVYYKNLKAFIQLIKSKKPNTYFYINSFIGVRKEYDKIIIEYIPSAKNLIFKSFNFELKEPLEIQKSSLKKKYEYLINKIDIEAGRYSVKIKEIDKTFYIKKLDDAKSDEIIKKIIEKKMYFKPALSYFDYDKINFPIIVRPFNEGDRFNPLGMKGSKKLKEYFIDKKVPANIRKIIPVILFDANIAWVFLNEISNDIKITERTRNVGIMRIG